MSNIAPNSSTATAAVLLDEVRALRRGTGPLAGLASDTYARDHAAFERLSDQRGLIAEHLVARLAELGDGPISMLSVGCGDGSLDSRLVEGLLSAVPGRAVRYVGVEPFSGSAELCTARMAALKSEELSARVHIASFAEASLEMTSTDETFDIVTFVHSMYYVADVADTLRGAVDLLRPGGELWVVNAPSAEINVLVGVLAPPLEGHPQWFSAEVDKAFGDAGIPLDGTVTLHALVDLASASDEVLDFAVQARLTPELRGPVRAYLVAVSVPGPDGEPRVPHPVDVFAATRR